MLKTQKLPIAVKKETTSVHPLPAPDHFEPLLDSDEAAAYLRIHKKTLQRMARSKEIPGYQIGDLWRFRLSSLNEWLASRIAS